MALKMNSSLRFPENRRLKTKIDSFLIDPLTCVDVRRQASDFALIGRQCSPETSFHQDCLVQSPSIDSTLDWSERTKGIEENLQKQIKSYKRSIKRNEKNLHRQQAVLRRLLQYAKVSPLLAAKAVSESNSGGHYWISKEKMECVASLVDGAKRCRSVALPYSRFCLEHILSDNKQVLYKRCSAIDSNTLKQCPKPVLEILQDKLYCKGHMRLAAVHSNEAKKSSSKLTVPTVKGSAGKRKASPARIKKKEKVAESAKRSVPRINPLALSILSTAEPLLTQASAPPNSASWNTTANDGGNAKKIQVEMIGDGGLLPPPMTPTLNNEMSLSFAPNDPKNDTLLPFSPDATVNSFSCPPLPPAPQVGLLPLGSTLMGNILDSSSSGEEMVP